MMTKCITSLFATALLLGATTAHAGVTLSQTTNIAAGISAFGPSSGGLTWANAFSPPGAWTIGVFGGSGINGTSPITDLVSGANATGNVNVRNWIDGAGFNSGALAAPDLAINGFENFTLHFTSPVSRIGFAAATGLGLLPSEFDQLGATFNFVTDSGGMGSFTLADTGTGYAAWISIASDTPFSSIQFTELGTNEKDQYFGNVLTAVPEPANWALMITGFGLTGAALRNSNGRRRAKVRFVTA